MTYIKNLRPTEALENNNTPFNAQHEEDPDLTHLRILGSTVYVFLHEEERALKSEKWKPRALRGKLVGFDGHTIYRVYIEEQSKVIRIKDLRIYEDYKSKNLTDLPTYEETPTFQGFPADDNDDIEPEDPIPINDKNSTPVIENASNPALAPSPAATTSRAGRTVKPTTKAREMPSKKIPPKSVETQETRALITKLVQLLNQDWSAAEATDETASSNVGEDPIKILATKLHSEANALDQSQFVCSTQHDVEEPETYNTAMQGPPAPQWSQAM